MPTPYDLNLPCLNPQCRSNGRPHPNCRCYGGYAKGGSVGHYCSEERAHKEDCEYFAEGGIVPEQDAVQMIEPEAGDIVPDQGAVEITSEGGGEIVPDQEGVQLVESPEEPTGTDPIERIKAGAEGVAQGLIGDLAKVIQVKSGISKLEDIERREKEYGTTHDVSKGLGFAGALAAPLGPARLITASVGSKLLGNLLASSAYALSDNTAKAFLGQPGGDAGSVVAGTILRGGMEGMMNTVTGGLFSALPKAARGVFSEKMIKNAENAMISLAEKPVSKALLTAGSYTGATKIGSSGVFGDLAEMKVIQDTVKPWVDKIIGKPLTKANNYVGDAVLNALAKSDFLGVPATVRWAQRATSGLNAVTEPMEALFKGGTHIAIDKVEDSVIDEIRNWMEEGGIDGEIERGQQENPQGFAKGGEVAPQNRFFERLYPIENVMLNQARGRVSGYLNTLRPSNIQMKAPFDMNPPQKQKEKTYKKALRMAANPLSIMEDINKGSLSPEDMQHYKAMWPEAYDHLSKKMTERVLKAQMSGEKPPYKKRQAMSLFLGADLDSSFSAQSIAVVQGMYAAKKQQRQAAVQGNKKAISKSSNSYQTPEQSREKRQQNQK